MVGLKNINYMSQNRFNSIGDTKDEEIYLVGGSKTATIIDSYVNGTSWYRVWSDGWIEQGGMTGKVADYGTATVILLKPYKDTNYTVTLSNWRDGTADDGYWNGAMIGNLYTIAKNSFQIYSRGS